MDVTVLAIAGCTGGVLLEDSSPSRRPACPACPAWVGRRVIASEAEAAAVGMRGSPALLGDQVLAVTGHVSLIRRRLADRGQPATSGIRPCVLPANVKFVVMATPSVC